MARQGRKIIDNRYQLLRRLGSGAMGEVYKVRDLKDNKIIALKILSKDTTSSAGVQRFKREFSLLAELRHPNLCSVYDFGSLEDGSSYFTMEYIDGKNIFNATKDLAHKKIYPLIVQLCRVLEYIHSKGLIHYDLKPGNVLIQKTADAPCVKLMDFGLVGEQRIKGGMLIRGTLPYIAPEVIRGLAVDYRADLYSLGIVLYEIFTKKSLQIDVKSSFVTLLKQSRDRITERPSIFVPGISKGLERLIIKLTDIEPTKRFSRANEAIKEINKIGHAKFALETEKTIIGYLLSSRFVGRDKEMELLKSSYAKARQGDGKFFFVTGDAGIGKSRLLKEFKILIQIERGHCVAGYASKDKVGSFEPFYDIFKELINQINLKSKLSHGHKLAFAILFKIFPDLAIRHLEKNLPELVPLEPTQEKLRMFGLLSELIEYCASDLGELVILLEDLHWADDLTIQFLEYLGRNLKGKNIFICGTSRKEGLADNMILMRMVSNLRNEGSFEQIELNPLNFKALYSFLDSTITSNSNSAELARYLMDKTGGNPLFVEETLRTLLQKGGVSIGERIGIEELRQIAVPRTVSDVVLKRITDLDENSRKVVNFAAILLNDFSYNLMKRLTGLDDSELSHSLWVLRRRQVLVEEGDTYRFYHAILRESVNKHLGHRERREFNYRSGKTLEYLNKERIEKVIEEVAYYYINARHNKKGIAYGLCAAEKSSERYANEYAILLYKEVLKLLGYREPMRSFNILQKLAKIEFLVGRYGDAIKHYKKALNVGVFGICRKLELYDAIGMIYENTGEYNKLLYIYRRALEMLEKMRPSKMKDLWKLRINVRLCTAYSLKGDLVNADKVKLYTLKFSTRGLRKKAEIQLLARIFSAIVAAELYKARYTHIDYDNVIVISKNSVKYLNKIHDEKYMAVAFTNLAVLYRYKVDLMQAKIYYRKAIHTMEKIGDRGTLPVPLYGLGECYYAMGSYAVALTYWQETYAKSHSVGSKLVTASSVSALGQCHAKLCHYGQAQEFLKKAMTLFDAMGFQDGKAYSMHALGEVHEAIGNYDFALKCHRKALRISKIMNHFTNIQLEYVNIGLTFLDIGVFSKAEEFINNALKITKDLKSIVDEIYCHIHLCRISILKGDYNSAINYYNQEIKIAKKFKLKPQLLYFCLVHSNLCYYEKDYIKGIEIANKAIKMAKEMGARDLHAEVLLIKVKNEIKRSALSKIEILTILNEAKQIAEEIGNPEILWKVYFEYGKFFQRDKQYHKALEYYQKCNQIFGDVVSKIKNERYKRSYLNRPDRQEVRAAVREIGKLLD